MQKLRSVHLYLGCIFAPMLLFFAISGIWQTLGYGHRGILQTLSSIHTGWHFKDRTPSLASPIMQGFILLMAVSFIVTTILGIVMAVKFGRSRRTAFFYCLAFGTIFPLAVILLRILL